MHFEVTGLTELITKLKDAEKALSELDGDIGKVSFNPKDESSIERAIAETHALIDERLAPYHDNGMIQRISAGLKEKYAAGIRARAMEAQAKQSD